ncbi:MAG: DUF4145 domain-containing protein [Anaerolineales bacterium]
MSFSWLCPFCAKHATIGNDNFAVDVFEFSQGNYAGAQALRSTVIVCPNKACAKYSLTITLCDRERTASGPVDKPAKSTWKLIPSSCAKALPDYVPKAIVEDYNEACAVKDVSPKASATLSRRCLQGMIRDFYGVSRPTLHSEIEAIRDQVAPSTWLAIDAVRQIGNIGAHMEKDINLIIEVDPKEAQLLLSLIETLIDDWYVVRYEREQRLTAIVQAAEAKKELRKPQS